MSLEEMRRELEDRYKELSARVFNVPNPTYCTHSTELEAFKLILKDGIIYPGLEESVSFSLDAFEWGTYAFLFPFEKMKPVTYPAFYVDIERVFVAYQDSILLSAWFGIWTREIRSDREVPLSWAESVIVPDEVLSDEELVNLIKERNVKILTESPRTPLYKWGVRTNPRIREAINRDLGFEAISDIVEVYNEMVSEVYVVDLEDVARATEKLKRLHG